MKRVFSLFLALAILFSMIVLPVSAAEPVEKTPEELAIMQKAVIETAMAYYRKGTNIIYDYATMSVQERKSQGISHLSSGDSPEMAAEDNILYTNCADFIYNVYMNAFGYAPAGDARHALVRYYSYYKSTSDPDVVLQFFNGTDAERDAFIEKAKEILQPGDVVCTAAADGIDRGHSMMYLGDFKGDGQEYAIHSSGEASTVSIGEDARKRGATVGLTNWGLFLGGGSFGVANKQVGICTILRPLNMIAFEDMTPAAKSRLAYSMLDIDRSSNVFGYTSVEQGQEMEITVSLRNAGTQDYKGLPVTEVLPVGAELVGAPEGAAVSDTGITWKVDLAAGEMTELTYKVKVTAAPGETVELPAGTVDDIATRKLSYTVCHNLIDPAPLAAVAKDKTLAGMTESTHDSELRFANEFYKKVLNFELGLPETVNEIIQALTEQVQVPAASATGGKMMQPKAYDTLTDEYKTFYDMILPDHLAGACMYLGTDPSTMRPQNRVMTMFEDSYMPGDIFILVGGDSCLEAAAEDVDVYINLGGGKVAMQDKSGLRIRNFKDTVPVCQRHNLVISLRPTLVYDNILPMPEPVEPEVPETPAVPETPEAPATESSFPVIPVVIGAAVILLVVIFVVLKKKKK